MDALMRAATRCAIGSVLLLPAAVFAQPPVTSPEQLAATRELFDLHAHGGHRSPSTMAYGTFNNGAELSCTDSGTSGERLVHYPLTIPSHLFLERVQVWGFDTVGSDRMRVRVLSTCQTNGGLDPPQLNVLAEAQSPNGTFNRVYFDLPVGAFGNNAGCVQTIEIRMAAAGQPCIGDTRTIMRVRAQAFNPEHIFRDGFVPRVAVPGGVASIGEQP
jgi:hypothetical protein